MLNINQATTIIVVMILFTSAGGLTAGDDLLKVSVASALAGSIIVMIADFIYSLKDGGTL